MHRLRQIIAAAIFGLAASSIAATAAPPAGGWLNGAAFRKQLEAGGRGIVKENIPLRQVIEGISREARLAVLVDRRVDPDQRVNFTLRDSSYQDILGRIAADRGLGMTVFGSVIYIGPPAAASRLRTVSLLLSQAARELPTDAQRRLLRTAPIQWPDLAEPRELLGDLASDGGISLTGLEQVPHDLWAAADLPPLSLADRLLVVAFQFGLTVRFAPDGTAAALVPIPDDVAIVKEYPGGRQPQQLAAKWAALAPDCEIRVAGDKIIVRGLVEDHERISQPAKAPVRQPPRGVSPERGEKRYTVANAKGPMDGLLQDLAGKLQLDVRIDRPALQRAGILPSVEVSFSVREATLDEMLRAIVEPAGCAFRREGNVVEVFPAR